VAPRMGPGLYKAPLPRLRGGGRSEGVVGNIGKVLFQDAKGFEAAVSRR
jgi:hypothetical protein